MTELVKITSPPQQLSLLVNKEHETAKLKAVSSSFQDKNVTHCTTTRITGVSSGVLAMQ